MTLFIQTFRYAAEPFFFSQSEKADAKQTYARVMNYFVITCAFIFLSVMMYIDIVKRMIGQDFRSGLPVVPILLMANLCLGVFYNLSIWYKLTGQTKWGAILSVLGAIITIALNVLLIPSMGYMGAAWATLICYASIMIISYIVGQKYYKVDYSLSSFFFYVGLVLVIYAVSNLLRMNFIHNQALIYVINTGFILLFITIAYIFEKNKKVTFASL